MSKDKGNKSKKIALLLKDGVPASPAVLGGKGAGLAELATLGMPVPACFTVTTSVARAFAQHQRAPKRLEWQLKWGIADLERQTGKVFGDPRNPLLVSVRSGAAVSMPGMMDTILNLGLNPDITRGLARVAGQRFAWDCYRRFHSMFGEVVLGVERRHFEDVLVAVKARRDVNEDRQLDGRALQEICNRYRLVIEKFAGKPISDDPRQQLEQALIAVLQSWKNPRAVLYRKSKQIPNNLGTAVNVQEMVFGNRDNNSGTGVVFSRNCLTGEKGIWGEFLINAQGEDVVAGSRDPMPIASLATWNLELYNQLVNIVKALEARRKHVVDVEFTAESGKLYILQVRKAKLHPEAAVTIATRLVWDRKMTRDQALHLVSPEEVTALQAQGFDLDCLNDAVACGRLLAKGLPASSGAAVGRVVLSSQAAVEAAAAGQKVILVRPDTSPDDLPGMLAAAAIVTKTGGATSHAAVVARGLGKPAVVGCSDLVVLPEQLISVDGKAGIVVSGEVKLTDVQRKKEVNIFLRWVAQEETKQWPEPRLNFQAFEESVSYNRLLNDFYLSDAMVGAAVGTALQAESARLRTSVHIEVAERLAMYIVVAVGGEIRHAKWSWDNCSGEIELLAEWCKVQLDKNDRAEAQRIPVNHLKTLDHSMHVSFLRLVAFVFNRGNWWGSYGGKRWANIAQAARGFLAGELSHSVFADHAFDLEHNGGSVFGKHPMLSGDRDAVKFQLDEKKRATSVSDLFKRLSSLKNEWSSEVEALYRKGERLGLWTAIAGAKKGTVA